MEKHKKEHNKYMKMNEKNCKCLIHQNNDFCCYCFDDKKNLCNECLKDNSHLEHFKLLFGEISPIKIGDKNEEIDICDNILNYYKQKIKDINEEKERKINDLYNKKQNELQSKYEEIEKHINSEEKILINKKNGEFLNQEERINKSW